MIFTKSISQANDVKNYLKTLGINSLISTSDDDKNSDEVQKFIKSDLINILIVVDRGVLGFNLPELVNIIDMKCGKNVSNLFQLFNRITRIHPDGVQKYFFKIVPESLKVEYMNMLSASLSLMFKSNYIKYNGTANELFIPVTKSIAKSEEVGSKKTNKGKIWSFEIINYINVPLYKAWKNHSNFKWATLNDLKDTTSVRNWSKYTKEENYQFCLAEVKRKINGE